MKKSALYILITVLFVFLIGVVTHLILTSNNNPSKNDKELIELKSEELMEYLGYVPKDYVIDEENNVYAKPKKVTDIEMEVLLGVTIDYANHYTDLAKTSISDTTILTYDKDEIDKLMSRLYNVKAEAVLEGEYGCTKVTAKQTIYEQTGGCGGGATEKLLSYIDSYEATSETLTIYEYNVYYKAHLGSTKDDSVLIQDMYTKKEENLLNRCASNEAYEDYEKCARNYFEGHKKEFTKYKHTFKKGNTGYYWFETEIA